MNLNKVIVISTLLFIVTACASPPQKNTVQSKHCHQLIQDVDNNNASAGDELLNQCLQKNTFHSKRP